MYSIEVDFDAYKALTLLREAEHVSYNDVIRRLLKLPVSNGTVTLPQKASTRPDGDWVVKNVRFQTGTQFRAKHKGVTYLGTVEGGALVVDGSRFATLSAAAMAITKTNVNGWRFWECRRPGSATWVNADSLRS